MPRLYLAKINVNSSIFDVYEDKQILAKIKDELFERFSNERLYDPEALEKNSGQKRSVKHSVYQLVEIEKHNGLSLPLELDFDGCEDDFNEWSYRVVTGRMIRKFNKPNEKYNESTKTVEAAETNEGYSIRFFFDIDNELLTFCERQNFGYSQFMNAFTYFLNEAVRNCQYPTDFKIYFQKDQETLNERLNNLQSAAKVKATLIPANSNADDLHELAEDLKIQEQMKQMNATEVHVEYSSSRNNLDLESNTMKDIKNSILHGYGILSITGKNMNGKLTTINSNKDAAYSMEVQENLGKNEFNRKSANLIRSFFQRMNKKLK